MKSVVACVVGSLLLVGCSQPQLPAGTRLFVASAATTDAKELSAKATATASQAFGWTIDQRGATPRADYVEVFAVTQGPLAGMIGTDPSFAGAPAKAIGFVARKPFRHSVKIVITSERLPGQLADGTKSPKQAEAFGYAIATQTKS